MTTYQMRKHLADQHRLVVPAATPAAFLAERHDADHRTGLAEHAHDHAGEGDG